MVKRLLFFALTILTSSQVNADTLTILNWEEYLSDETIKAWETKTGHTIKEIYFDNDEARDSFLVRTELEFIDIAMMDEPSSHLFGEASKLIAVKDFENFHNAKHIDPSWQERCGDFSVPYLWGTMGLVYRNDIFSTPPGSWNVLLSPDNALKGHFSYLKDSIDTFAPVLLSKGLDVNTDNLEHLREAFSNIKSITPYILTLEYPITFVGSNARADDLHLGVAYSGDQWAMNEVTDTENWSYTVPEEGTILWVDCLAVTASTKHKDLAFSFINFINSPVIAAENSESLYVATTNLSAKAKQSLDILNDPSVYPPQYIIDKGQHYIDISSENLQLRNRMASAILKTHEFE